MGSRTWIKVHCEKWLLGTLRDETPEVRSVWIDLLVLAGGGHYGDVGEVKLTSNGMGWTDKQISEILHIKPSLWRRAKQRFLESQRIEVSSKGAIRIINWSKYQSEYNRQKPYREAKGNSSTPKLKSLLENTLENRDKRIESKKLQPEVTTESYNLPPPPRDESNNDFKSQGGTLSPPSGKLPLPNLDRKLSTSSRKGKLWRVIAYLESNGGNPHNVNDICQATGFPDASVRMMLSYGKSHGLVVNASRGMWAIVSKNATTESPPEQVLSPLAEVPARPITGPEVAIASMPLGNSLEELKANWKQIIEQASEDNTAILRSANVRPVSIEGDTVILAFRYPLHKEHMEKAKNQKVASEIISNFLGRSCQVRCIVEKDLK